MDSIEVTLAPFFVGIKIMQYRAQKLVYVLLSFLWISLFATLPTFADVKFDEQCAEGLQTNLPVSKWLDRSIAQRGTVVLIHGITQRAYSLNVLATDLAADGFVVYGIDQRGHGRWHFQGKKGDKGYACNFKQTVKDVDRLMPFVKQSYPELPLFLIGESAGAGVAIRSAADAPDMVHGVVLAGTGCKTGHVKLTWALEDIIGNFYRLNHQISVIRYQRKYGTDDLVALEENLKDPWQRPTMSAREMFCVAKFMQKNAKYAKKIGPNTSVLVIQGCDDKVLKPKSAEKVLANIPSADKRIVEVEHCGHILLGTNHPKPIVTNSITDWLDHGVGDTAVATVQGVITH
jgi:alpha-beta hydrolase superfamily lysophospholipase